MKKQTISLIGVLATCFFITVGCSALLEKTASPTSVPVQLGVATTNDVNLVAYEELIQQLNNQLNPTPSRELVDTILGALISLTSAVAGWVGRHAASPTTSTVVQSAPTPTKT
jgi:hypothetical protein